MRHSLELLRSQVQARQVDADLLARQVDKIVDFVGRAEQEHRMLKREQRFEILYNVTRSIGESLDVQVVLDQVMDAVIQVSGSERGFLMLRNDDGQLEVAAARNLDQQTLSSDKFEFSRTIVNRVLDGGKPIVTTNAAEDPRFANQLSIVGAALRSIMASPLRLRGRVIGVAYCDNRAITGLFDEDDLVALETLTVQAAFAIENARLFAATDQALSRRLDELTQLRRVDQQMSETLDPRKIMATVLDWACRLAGAEVGHIAQPVGDPPSVQAIYHYGVTIEDTQPMELERYYPKVLEVLRTGETVASYDSHNNVSVLIVPIRREKRVISLVVLRREGEFAPEAQDLVERVITRAGVAIENAQLYEKVQAADKAKSEFVGIVAHDLKVPMTSILGYADLTLMDGGLAERQGEFIGKIKDTVRRMEILVADLADISRIESGHFYMDPTRVSVDAIVQEVRDATLTQIRARDHAFVEQVADGLPEMYVDYYRLMQVLTNLVSNAYKYTPEGGRIILTVRRAGDRVQFSVSDTGIGMTPQQVAMLGTKFWRADDDFTRAQPGTGLGFAITKALVELMGSEIKIDSTVGKGSTFMFSVPVAKGHLS
ncbi:MAG: GAF domain-containing sensor histidine kinase [Chloroflexota bacterium]|nr:GAF domain-containing sensor histidine kinase [Chloroflexota bacterium]